MSESKPNPRRRVRTIARLSIALGVAAIVGWLASTFASAPIDLDAFPPRDRAVPPPVTAYAQVSLLPTGAVSSKEGLLVRGGVMGKDVALVMTAILVEHERGAYLFDAGLATMGAEHFAGTPFLMRALSELEMSDAAKVRLDGGTLTSTLTGILLSHSHWDHVSGLADFADTLPVYVHPDEVAFAETHPMAELSREIGHPLTPLAFDDGPYEMWSSSEDIFSDGSVVLVPLPGHTPGSMGLFVTTKTKRFFFVGDLVWSVRGLHEREERPWVARRDVDVDPARVREHIIRTHRLMKADPSLVVVPAHDETAAKRVPVWQPPGPGTSAARSATSW